ncbi:MAG: ParB/RepB/Spo0J family partition protein [Magnetococcales bacterium]|nr:ParB/RepB/Spo0J family partition protein [Magnetococcales bacterium]
MKPKPKGSLGRGLGSLLGAEAADEEGGTRVRMMPVHALRPGARQPRTLFDREALSELSDSIREQGVLQPILARELESEEGDEERYEIVAGERRWRAAQAAGLREVPVLIRAMDDRTALEASILENVQREDLNPVEEARGYHRLTNEFGLSHQEVAQRVGKNRITITNAMRLLKLPEETLERLNAGELSEGHARALLALENAPKRLNHAARQVVEERLSVRETERLARELAALPGDEEADAAPPPELRQKNDAPPRTKRRDPGLMSMEQALETALTARVSITHAKGKGRIILEYGSLGELERLTARLLGGNS